MLEDDVDGPVGEVVEVDGFLVGVHAPRRGIVEHLLEPGVGDGRHHLHYRLERLLDRRDQLRVARLVVESDDRQREHRREVQLRWHERCGRGAEPGEEHPTVLRQAADVVTGEAEQVGTLVRVKQEQTQMNHRTDRVQRELELGHDTEVAPTTADRPEEIRIFRLRRVQVSPFSGHHARSDDVVAGEPDPANEPADPATQGQSSDAGRADETTGHGQSVCLGRGVKFAPGRPAATFRPTRRGVDRHCLQRRGSIISPPSVSASPA